MARRLDFYIILTADGMYADLDGGLDHYDPAEDEHQYANDLARDTSGVVMGRVMYDVMAYWDELDLADPDIHDVEREYAELWRATPKYVVSQSEPTVRANAQVVPEVLHSDVVEAIRTLKAVDGPPLGLGCGAQLFATLSEAGLIDTYRFLVIPKVLGEGKWLFGALHKPLDLRLIGTRTFEAGSVLLEYERAST